MVGILEIKNFKYKKTLQKKHNSKIQDKCKLLCFFKILKDFTKPIIFYINDFYFVTEESQCISALF